MSSVVNYFIVKVLSTCRECGGPISSEAKCAHIAVVKTLIKSL